MYAYTKTSKVTPKEDHLAFDFQIINLEGEIVAEILNFSFVKLASLPDDFGNEDVQELEADALEDDILPEEGAQVIDTILSNSDLTQMIVYTMDLQYDIDDSTHSALIQKRKDKISNVKMVEDIDDRPDIDELYVAPENDIEKNHLHGLDGHFGNQ